MAIAVINRKQRQGVTGSSNKKNNLLPPSNTNTEPPALIDINNMTFHFKFPIQQQLIPFTQFEKRAGKNNTSLSKMQITFYSDMILKEMNMF